MGDNHMNNRFVLIHFIGLILICSGAYVNAVEKEILSTQTMEDDNTLIVEFGGNESLSGNRAIEVDRDGNIVWEFGDIEKPHDIELLPNGNLLITIYAEQRIIEVTRGGNIVWEITDLIEPMDAERLKDGNTLIVEYGNNRVIEIESDGTIVWEKNGLRRPFDAERLSNGNTLITQTWPNGSVIEVENDGTIVWEKDGLDAPVDAERLANGNTLITEHIGKKVSEVDKDGNEVWNISNLYVPKDAERLGNNNTLIVDCGANRVIEVDSSGTIKWIKSNLVYPTDAERLGQEPGKPTIEGPKEVRKGTPTAYTFNAVDPDDDQILYNISWGDGDDTGWIGRFDSGKDVNITHTWDSTGSFVIKCQAKDVHENIGPENSTEITVPKHKAFDFVPFFLRFFERHPYLFSLLIQLLGL